MTAAEYKKERLRRGLPQRRLAELLGIHVITVSHRETGDAGIGAEAEAAIKALPVETTPGEQARHVAAGRVSRPRRTLVFQGVTLSIDDWAAKLRITAEALRLRLKAGWRLGDPPPVQGRHRKEKSKKDLRTK